MKRLISIMIASVLLTMTLSTGLTALAADDFGANTKAVSYTSTLVSTEELTPTYSFEITWGSLEFTYEAYKKQQWNTEKNVIETVLDTEKSKWTTSSSNFTVKNNSNVGIKVSMNVHNGGALGETAKVSVSGVDGETWVQPGKSITGTLSVNEGSVPMIIDGTAFFGDFSICVAKPDL